MPVDIEQWRAGIGNFSGCCQYPVARIKLRVHNIFSAIFMSASVFLLILLYLKSQYYFTFLARFFSFHFFTFFFGTANTQNILFKDKYFALLYWTSQLYLSTNFIYLNTISSFNGLYFMYFLHILLLQHGDTDRNPGP